MKSFFKRFIIAIITIQAKLVLRRHRPNIIAVTGSVGKTSTKDAIFSVLADNFYVRKSEKSFNSEIGVPLTIIGRHNAWTNIFGWTSNIFYGFFTIIRGKYPQWLILEVGADRPGDITNLASWITPDIVVITAFAEVPVHVEFFQSREELIAEKAAIASALNEDGFLITNSDDLDAKEFKNYTRAECINYGFLPDAQVRALQVATRYRTGVRGYPLGVRISLSVYGKHIQIDMPGVLGRQNAYHILSAIATGVILRIPMEKIISGLMEHQPPPGRMKIIPGLKKTVIIDDTYNSSPIAMQEALETLKLLTVAGKRIAVLGDMLELGKYSIDEHKKIGKYVGEFVDVLITVGLRARTMAEGALQAQIRENAIFQFEDTEEAGRFLQDIIEKGDIILIKGSQGMRMERIVEEIMAEPENAEKLLVRQEPEWKKR